MNSPNNLRSWYVPGQTSTILYSVAKEYTYDIEWPFSNMRAIYSTCHWTYPKQMCKIKSASVVTVDIQICVKYNMIAL